MAARDARALSKAALVAIADGDVDPRHKERFKSALVELQSAAGTIVATDLTKKKQWSEVPIPV